jgi:hypothetical protein
VALAALMEVIPSNIVMTVIVLFLGCNKSFRRYLDNKENERWRRNNLKWRSSWTYDWENGPSFGIFVRLAHIVWCAIAST